MGRFRVLAATVALAGVVAAAGCKTGDISTNPGEEPPVVTPITCTVNGVAGPCTLPVTADIASFGSRTSADRSMWS